MSSMTASARTRARVSSGGVRLEFSPGIGVLPAVTVAFNLLCERLTEKVRERNEPAIGDFLCGDTVLHRHQHGEWLKRARTMLDWHG